MKLSICKMTWTSEGLLLTISSCIHLQVLLMSVWQKFLLLTISSCIHMSEKSMESSQTNAFSAVTETYCSLYRAVFTGLYSCSNVNGNLIPYCSLYRAVFTTVYIILSISDYHLFSHKSTYYY